MFFAQFYYLMMIFRLVKCELFKSMEFWSSWNEPEKSVYEIITHKAVVLYRGSFNNWHSRERTSLSSHGVTWKSIGCKTQFLQLFYYTGNEEIAVKRKHFWDNFGFGITGKIRKQTKKSVARNLEIKKDYSVPFSQRLRGVKGKIMVFKRKNWNN